LIRLIVAFVVATKHHLRAEGGIHHEDLKGECISVRFENGVKLMSKGLLPPRLAGSPLRRIDKPKVSDPFAASPIPMSPKSQADEEASLGLPPQPLFSPSTSQFSTHSHDSIPKSSPGKLRAAFEHLRPVRAGLKRRPTNVRIVLPEDQEDCPLPHPTRGSGAHDRPPLHEVTANEHTPLIKPGVTPDIRRTAEDVERSMQVEVGLGKMVQLGLPLIL
jgi:putative membrane protein